MPNTINIYETRNMAAVIKRTPPVRTFIRDTFFRNVKTSTSEKVDIDIKKGNRQLAPFVHRTKGGKIIPNSGYETKTFTPPMLAPDKLTMVDDLMARQPGEDLYSQQTPQQRAVVKMAEDFTELEEVITRREEWMCTQALFKGYIPVIGDGVNYVIDFDFENREEITIDTKKWSDRVNSRPLEDVARYKKHVQKTGYVNCDICIMGEDAAEDFINNESVLKVLDVKNVNMGAIAPKELPNGATYIGYYAKENISFYTYNEWYVDDWTDPDAQTVEELIPRDEIALLSTKANYSMLYGAITLIDEKTKQFVTYVAKRVPDTEVKKKPARRFLTMYSSPLPCPAEANSWFVAKVR